MNPLKKSPPGTIPFHKVGYTSDFASIYASKEIRTLQNSQLNLWIFHNLNANHKGFLFFDNSIKKGLIPIHKPTIENGKFGILKSLK